MKKTVLILLLISFAMYGSAQLRPGDMAPEISLPDTKDSVINLSAMRGKVVLIDFWASWCAPCRAANPYIQKLYKKYNTKGFEVFAVSIDTKKELWRKAIRQDRLTYTQVIENSGWNSKVAERYFVDYLPTNFLVDQTGKIVAINIEGKELFDKVKSMVE